MPGYQILLPTLALLAAMAAATAPIPRNSACIPGGPVCVDGTICAGNDSRKKCVVPMEVGQVCGRDPFWVCAEHLDCVEHVCTERPIPEGGNCLPDGSQCVTETVCAGTDTAKTCVSLIPEGGVCTEDVLSVCDGGFECVEGFCGVPAVPEGGDCLPDGSRCVSGTVCVGTQTAKSCVPFIPEGGACSDDVLSVCEDGLACVDGYCGVPPIPEGGNCIDDDANCMEGTVCAGTDVSKTCVKPIGSGGACTEGVLSVCEGDLECVEGYCTVPRIPEGGDCLPEDAICVDGTTCAGSIEAKTCITPIGPEGLCTDDVLSVCEEDLECIDGACSPLAVPNGGDCSAEDAVCMHGTVCAGRPRRRRCVTPMQAGGRCGQDPRWVCDEGLVCMQKVCKPAPLPEGSDCLPDGSVCEEGTVCAGGPTRKRCVLPMQVGGPCGTDPRWICDEGLECMQKVCVRAPVPEGGNCRPEGSICREGTVCAGRKHRLCVKPMPEGGRCGRDPRWVCGEGLVCLRKTCQRNPLDVGEDCLADGSTCVKGAVCTGSDSDKVCVVPGEVGDTCGADLFSICKMGHHCENGVCGGLLVGGGKACDGTTKVCSDGFHCTEGRTSGSRVCGKARLEGERCKDKPRHRCASGLSCISGTCLSDEEYYP